MALRRTPFRSKAPTPAPRREAPQWTGATLPTPREPASPLRIHDGKARLTVPLPKNPPLRSVAYRRWVATKQCIHCSRPGPSQCAHSDSGGKGLAIKAGDDTCYPLCADGPERRGCHSIIGASGIFTREQRRTLEATYAADTREAAKNEGAWPRGW